MSPGPGGRGKGRVRRRVESGIGLDELDGVERRLVPVEEAVAENSALAAPLTRHVARLEAALLPVLENALGERAADDR